MRRRRGAGGGGHDEEGPSHERWLVSYADFITLMFAFFAVLYATSQHDVEKSKEFQESIKRFLIKAGAFGESGAQINQGKKEDSAIEPPIQTYGKQEPETARILDKAEDFIEGQLTKEERARFVLDVTADQWGVRVILRGDAIYAAASDKFRGDAMPFLEKFGALLPGLNRAVMIEGHVAPGEKGGARSTWDFSSARAVNMLRFLQVKENLKQERLTAAAFGDSRPQFKGADNSRIEIVLLNSDMEM